MSVATETAVGRVRGAAASAGRMLVPDVLRGIAIIAMLLAHAQVFLPDVPWALKFAVGNVNNLASPLFALVMGMSAQIVWNRGGSIWATLVRQWIRGVALIALGVWMATWGSWVAIVLQYLGLLLIVGVPILLLRTRWVVVIAAAVALVSQPVLELARTAMPWVYSQDWLVQELVTWTAYGRSYRLINLLPFFLLGALLLRHGFKRDRVLVVMAAIAPIAWLSYRVLPNLLGFDTRSGDWLDTLGDVGLVFAVYVVVVLAATVRRERTREGWVRVFAPLSAWGQLALSLYVLHVGLIVLWAREWGRPAENAYLGWVIVVLGSLAVAWLWWRFVGTGPVEWVLALVTGKPKKWRVRG